MTETGVKDRGEGLLVEAYAIETGEGACAPSPSAPPPMAISTTVHCMGRYRKRTVLRLTFPPHFPASLSRLTFPPHFPASLSRLTFPHHFSHHFSSSLPHTRLSGGYRHALPLPPEGAGEERRRRGWGRGLREEFCMTETGVKDRGEGLLIEPYAIKTV